MLSRVEVVAILLAAGESSRIGTPKPLLEWYGQTLIEYQLAQLRQPPLDGVLVVLGHRADEIRPLVEAQGTTVVVNERYREGRASSLRAGAAALSDGTAAVMVLSVDQPRPHIVLQRLIEEHRRSASLITVPSFGGRRGHPPVLDASLLPELRVVRESSQGLRSVIKRHQANLLEVPFDSPVVLLDINRPEEYEAARASYCQHPPEADPPKAEVAT